jgi:hypothetical protein
MSRRFTSWLCASLLLCAPAFAQFGLSSPEIPRDAAFEQKVKDAAMRMWRISPSQIFGTTATLADYRLEGTLVHYRFSNYPTIDGGIMRSLTVDFADLDLYLVDADAKAVIIYWSVPPQECPPELRSPLKQNRCPAVILGVGKIR